MTLLRNATSQVLVLLLAGAALPAGAQEPIGAELVGGPVTPVTTAAVRDLPPASPWRVGDPVKEIPRHFYPRTLDLEPQEAQPDPLAALQRAFPETRSRAFTTPIVNIDGIGYTGVNPPDTVGDVGASHYVQTINGSDTKLMIWNKDGTPALAGPINLGSLGTGSCANGSGDPIVLYDQEADRWFIQEFTYPSTTLCFYVSQTPDPTGAYYHYQFSTPNGPDYPHFGIWSNAYLMTTNESGSVVTAYALDRVKMLAGETARPMQRFTTAELDGYGFQALTPADWDGAEPPPPGAPALFMRHYDDEAHDGSPNPATDTLQLYTLSVDWDTPANSSLSAPVDIPIAEFNSWFMNYDTFYSVPQPGSSNRLDPIREVILNRLQYRNFGTHQTLVGVLPTNIDPAVSGSTVNAGLRWFELRNSGAGWVLHQEGTYDPDDASTTNRFVGSIAMDQSGNLALGYSFTDTAGTPASVRFAGRTLEMVTPGLMDQPETTLVTGSGAGSGRWGDYASMNVDPVDDCTFWFTGEYIKSGSQWGTRIGSFRTPYCGCELALGSIAPGWSLPADNTVRLSWGDAATPEITEYRVYRSLVSGGPYQLVDLVADTSPGAGGGAGYTWDDGGLSGGTTYYYLVRASDGETCLSPAAAELAAAPTGACTLAPTFAGIADADNAASGACSVELAWPAGASRCGGAVTYEVHRSTTPGFTPGPATLLASDLVDTAYVDTSSLASGTEYYYLVQAVDTVNAAADGNAVEESAVPSGPDALFFADDMEGGTNAWVAEAGPADPGTTAPWSLVTTSSSSPTHSWFVTDQNSQKDQVLRTAVGIDLTASASGQLVFQHNYDTESGWDGGVLEYSTDGGATWYDILAGNGGGVPANPDRFLEGEYNRSLNTTGVNPLRGRQAWSGSSSGWDQVAVDLADFFGETVLLRWRMGCDGSVGDVGWYLDDVHILQGTECQSALFACDFEHGTMSTWSANHP